MKKILQKHIIGIVEKGVATIQNQRSPQVTALLMHIGTESPEFALKEFHTGIEGLTAHEAVRRLKQHGKNEVAREKPPRWWMQLADAFINPFIAILLVLGLASFFTDVFFAAPDQQSWMKIIILSIMAAMSGGLRFWQEFRSQREAEKLKALVQNKALVSRQSWDDDDTFSMPLSSVNGDGHKREIPVSYLVPGDIVHLSAGDMVPADVRLLLSQDLFASQSALTGESMPVEKYGKISEVSEKLIKEQTSNSPLEMGTLCFMGTNIVSGSGTGVVIATGEKTYFGSMARGITSERPLTSFDKGVNKVSWILIRFMLVMAPVVFVTNGITKGDWKEALFFALAVAVGMTPELLPLVVTANLAKGAIKMAKQKVIVKKLNSIQNFGAMDILCTDKTGTLTENRVVLIRHLDPEGRESTRVLHFAYLNSFFQTGLKNIMDQAVIDHKEKAFSPEEEKQYTKIDEIPFDFARRRMSVIVEKDHGEHVMVCKGATEEVMERCMKIELDGKVIPLTGLSKKQMHALTRELNAEGLRALAVAYKPIGRIKRFYTVEDENDLVLAGYVGFLDPAKASAKDALRLLEHHGVKVKVITGDNDIVTTRICKDVELEVKKMLLGNEIDALSDDALAHAAEETTIFAKVDPLQKARIIEALKKNGHTVGYMGDGINDAAAMREADVGISVDGAVDIAKEAADIVLLENDLMVLENGVVEGRTIFGNIMKYIKMASSSNFGNVLSVMVASVFIPFLPMLPIHLLIQNLLYDFSQLSIPLDTMDKEFLRKPKKWEATGIARFMIFIGPISSIFDITTFLIMWFVFQANTPAHQALFQSGWFVEGLLSQTLIVHMIRTQKIPFIQSRAPFPVLLLTGLVMMAGIIFPFTLPGKHVGLQALPLLYFPFLIATLLLYSTITQVVKTWYIKRFNAWL